MKEKINDFKSKIEGMAGIIGAIVSSQIDKEKLDQQVKFYLQMGESVIKETVKNYITEQLSKMPLRPQIPVNILVKRCDHFKGDLPKYESDGASGIDVRAQIDEDIVLSPRQRVLIPTGLCFEIPQGYEVQARPRSGLAIKKGIALVNSPGTIDADYRGEIKIIVINLGEESVEIKDQDRIAQLVVAPVLQADFQWTEELSDTDRGEGGFGSTGTN